MPSYLIGFEPSVSFAENTVNATPQLIDSDVVFITSGSLAGGRLVVGGLLAEDRVSILTQGNGAGQIGVSGSTISYGGVTIGTATGGVGGDFTVTFASAVTGAAVDALIQRLAYGNISDAPTATRSLTLDVVDAAGGRLATAPTARFAALTGSANPFNGIDVGSNSTPSFVDLDSDGRLDLVSGEFNGTLLAWRNTDSGFTALTGSANPFNGIDVGLGSSPSFVDLDGDGRLDLVSGASDGTLLAWRNTGSATAPAFTALTGSANPFNGIDVGVYSTPSFVDLDADGRLDLVSREFYGTLLAWRNTGSATAPAFTALTGSANPFNGFGVLFASSPSFVDLNGDGRLDLVSGESFGTLLAWRNTGSSFTALTGSANPFNGFDVGSYSAPTFVDLDNDGRLDLVSGASDGTLRTWRNIPSVTVTVTAQNDAPPQLTGLALDVTFAENTVNATPQLIDSDVVFITSGSLEGGRLVVGGLLAEDRVSILTGGSDAGQIDVSGSTISYGGVAIGTATGGVGGDFTVTFTSAVTSPAVDALIQRLAYGNISDTPTATRSLTLDVVDAAGRLATAPTAQFAALTGSANPFNGIDVGSFSSPSFVDLDGDGRLDLVSGASDGTLLAWRNTGSAGAPAFTALTGSANPFNGIDVGGYSTPSFVDLDGDGRLDLVSGASDGTLRVWRNTGSGFTPLTGSANPFDGFFFDVGRYSTPSFVDLDGDGRLDLVSGKQFGTLQAWRNTGSATAPAFTALTGSANPFIDIEVGVYSTPSFVDLDGDGRLDLVLGEGDGTLLAWRNTGSAGAPAFTALTGSANPFNGIDVGNSSAPSFVDLDGDGRLDLVSGEMYGTLRAWRNIPSITVTVTAQNDAPAITSAATVVSAENRPAGDIIYQATANDPDVGATLNWSLFGIDAALFTIDATTGAVRFRTSPNFEAPADTGGNNVYDLIVIATDNVFSPAGLAVAVTVTDAVGPAQLGTAGPDALIVGAENALLFGIGGNDTLTGGVGSDTLVGGDGNDVFVISDTLDLIIETAGGGADTIITSVSMTMPDHVETFQIAAGISGITITGGAGNDMLIGNGLSNNLNGGAGDDVILAGNVTLADIYALFAT
jgi:uncharacterized protein (DUF2141 family)